MFYSPSQGPFRVVLAALGGFLASCGGGGGSGGLDPPPPDPRIISFDGSDVVSPGHIEDYALNYVPGTASCTISDASNIGQVVQTSVVPSTSRYSYTVPDNTTSEGATTALNGLCTGASGTKPDSKTKSVLVAHKAFAQFLAASGQVTRLNYNSTFGLQVSPFTKTCSSQISPPPAQGSTLQTTSPDCQSVSFKLGTMPVGSLVPGSGAIPGQERYTFNLSVTAATEDTRYPAHPSVSVEMVSGDPNLETYTTSDGICDGQNHEIHVRASHPIFSFNNGSDYVGSKMRMVSPNASFISPYFVLGSESTDIFLVLGDCNTPPGQYSLWVQNSGVGGGLVQLSWNILPPPAGVVASAAAMSEDSWMEFVGRSGERVRVSAKPLH